GPRSSGSTRPPAIRTANGGITTLVIVRIRPLQHDAEQLGADDQHDAAEKAEPRTEPEGAVDPERGVVFDEEVGDDGRSEGRDEHDPQPSNGLRSGQPVISFHRFTLPLS